MKVDNNRDKLQDLGERARLEGSELGEYWQLLMQMNQYEFCMSNEFKAAFNKELKQEIKRAQEDFDIVKEEETRTREVKHLEYNEGNSS